MQSVDLIQFSLDQLILGRKVGFPIYDANGVLLVSEGTRFTPEVKQRLAGRGAGGVLTSSEAAARMGVDALDIECSESLVSFRSDLTEKLDALLGEGFLSARSNGPPAKNNVVYLGRRAFENEMRSEIIEQHNRNSRALSEMMRDALHGEAGDGSVIAIMAADYLKQMCADKENVLTSAIDTFQSDNLCERSLETCMLAMSLGIELGFTADDVRVLGVAGLVHDWGMMRVPQEVRESARPLTPSESLEIRKHPIYSLEFLQQTSSIPRAVPLIVYQVHELGDGSGYPRGRTLSGISIFARVLQVADAFVAMNSVRKWRKPLSRYTAMNSILHLGHLGKFDRDVVRALLRVQSLFPIGSLITLDDGSIARVIRPSGENFTAPIVQLMEDGDGNPCDPDADSSIVDLSETDITVVQALPTPRRGEMTSDPILPPTREPVAQ